MVPATPSRTPTPIDRGRICDVEGCDRRHFARGYCLMHYNRWRTGGDLAAPPGGWAVEDRLRRYTVTANGCHEWDGHFNHYGYPVIRDQRRRWIVHRLVWTLANGPIPAGVIVRHACGNRRCINLERLELTTFSETGAGRVVRAPRAAEQVAEIRRRHSVGDVSQRLLALEFGVRAQTISRIVKRKTYRPNR
jgi:hypothetical protein